jgi:hypothetical protein
MRICLATLMTLATLTLAACGESDPPPQTEPFEIDGPWLYLGPSDVPHDLTIGQGSMVFTDVAGAWSSTWTIKAHDNAMNQFQLQFASGSGAYLPVGDSLSGAYDVGGTLLTLQLVSGLTSYPPLQGPGTCTGTTDGMPVAGCKLYVKKN